MVRVLFYAAMAILLCSAALLYLPICFIIIAGAFSLATAITFLILRRKRMLRPAVCLLITAAFCLVGTLNYYHNVEPAKHLANKHATVIGTVADYPTKADGYTLYEIKVLQLRIDDPAVKRTLPKKLKIKLLDTTESNLSVFDVGEFFITFSEIDEYQNTNYADGIYASAAVDKFIKKRGIDRPFYACFYDFRKVVEHKFGLLFNKEEAGFANALLLGDKSGLNPSFSAQVRVTGVSHVMVVSGMHLGIIFQLVGYLFGFFGLSRRKIGLVQLFTVFALCAVCGFSPSVVRAGLTYFIVAAGTLLNRRPDALNSLGFAAIVTAFFNPYLIANVSAMLSYASTFALLFACPIIFALCLKPFAGHCPRPIKAIIFALVQTGAATLFTFPITVLVFGYLSLAAPITNILISYAATVLLSLLFILAAALFLPAFFTPVTAAMGALCKLLIKYITSVVFALSGLDRVLLGTNRTMLYPWAMVIGILLIIAIVKKFKKVWLKVAGGVVSAALLITSCYGFYGALQKQPQFSVAAMKVGNGVSAIIYTKELSFIVGAGNSQTDYKKVQNKLFSFGDTKAAALLLPSLQQNVAGGAGEMILRMNFDHVLAPDKGKFYNDIKYLKNHGQNNIIIYHDYCRYEYGKNISAVCLYGVGSVINIKDYSVIVYSGNSHFEKLEKFAKSNQRILIFNSVLPRQAYNDCYKAVIFSGDETTADTVRRMQHYRNIYPLYYTTDGAVCWQPSEVQK